MPSLPASQPAEDGEAVGTPVPAAYDPSSAEPLPHRDGARKSVGPPPIGRNPNAFGMRWQRTAAVCTIHNFRNRNNLDSAIHEKVHSCTECSTTGRSIDQGLSRLTKHRDIYPVITILFLRN